MNLRRHKMQIPFIAPKEEIIYTIKRRWITYKDFVVKYNLLSGTEFDKLIEHNRDKPLPDTGPDDEIKVKKIKVIEKDDGDFNLCEITEHPIYNGKYVLIRDSYFIHNL